MIIFKELFLGDVEDPQLYAGFALHDWEKSDEGNWVMNNCIEPPVWSTYIDHNSYGYKVRVYGKLTEENEIIYRLKFCNLSPK